ncbi:MAG TPA: hydrogenase small subunit [Planctomycetota bacterium]|nr:hydrogenase small subunit [Planctomycetota bacterium]
MAEVREYPAVWLQGGSCSGCVVSVLNAVSPNIRQLLVDPVVPGRHVSLRFQPTVMAGSGEVALSVLPGTEADKGFVLIVEGSIPTANPHYCMIGETGGHELSMLEKTCELASRALAVVCVGTCSSFGGIPAGAPNPTGSKGLRAVLAERGISVPVVNIPGCPPHPDWFVHTVASVLLNGLPGADALDDVGRPLEFYGRTIHEQCPRRPDFDAGKFAKKHRDSGCLYLVGCKGPVTYADCPTRMWNSGTNWCVGANGPCIGCVEPSFPDLLSPLYEKICEERLPRLACTTRS